MAVLKIDVKSISREIEACFEVCYSSADDNCDTDIWQPMIQPLAQSPSGPTQADQGSSSSQEAEGRATASAEDSRDITPTTTASLSKIFRTTKAKP